MEIEKKIITLRLEFKMTQTDLTEILNTTQDTISLWELGKSYPNIFAVIKLAEIFDVSCDFLLGKTEY